MVILKTIAISYLCLCLPIFFLSINAGEYQSVHLKAVMCNASEQYMYPNFSCFAKALSRNLTTATVWATAKRPLSEIFVSQIQIKEFTVYVIE